MPEIAIALTGLVVTAYVVGLVWRFILETGRTRRYVSTLRNIRRLERELGIDGAEPAESDDPFFDAMVEAMSTPITLSRSQLVPLVRSNIVPREVGARMLAMCGEESCSGHPDSAVCTLEIGHSGMHRQAGTCSWEMMV